MWTLSYEREDSGRGEGAAPRSQRDDRNHGEDAQRDDTDDRRVPANDGGLALGQAVLADRLGGY